LNIAFPAILLFLLLSPGFVAHRVYKPREIRAADLTPFSSTILTATTCAATINVIVLVGATYFCGYQFHLGVILHFFVGGSSTVAENALSAIYSRLDAHPLEPFYFFITTNLLALFIALMYRWAVSQFHLDQPNTHRLYRLFRSPAPWYYLFSGEDTTDITPEAVIVSVVVSFKDAPYLFTGMLVDYELTEKGELDRLIICNASRRKLADDRTVDSASSPLGHIQNFYPIEGDRFVIRSTEFSTLNIKFLVSL